MAWRHISEVADGVVRDSRRSKASLKAVRLFVVAPFLPFRHRYTVESDRLASRHKTGSGTPCRSALAKIFETIVSMGKHHMHFCKPVKCIFSKRLHKGFWPY